MKDLILFKTIISLLSRHKQHEASALIMQVLKANKPKLHMELTSWLIEVRNINLFINKDGE